MAFRSNKILFNKTLARLIELFVYFTSLKYKSPYEFICQETTETIAY